MDWTIFKDTINSVVRHGLGILFGLVILPLAARHIVGPDIVTRWQGALDSIAMLITGTLITVGLPWIWSWWKAVSNRAKVAIALRMNPTASLATVQRVADAMPAAEKLSLATSPGTVAVPKEQP